MFEVWGDWGIRFYLEDFFFILRRVRERDIFIYMYIFFSLVQRVIFFYNLNKLIFNTRKVI